MFEQFGYSVRNIANTIVGDPRRHMTDNAVTRAYERKKTLPKHIVVHHITTGAEQMQNWIKNSLCEPAMLKNMDLGDTTLEVQGRQNLTLRDVTAAKAILAPAENHTLEASAHHCAITDFRLNDGVTLYVKNAEKPFTVTADDAALDDFTLTGAAALPVTQQGDAIISLNRKGKSSAVDLLREKAMLLKYGPY